MAYQTLLFNAEAIILQEYCWYYLTHSYEDLGFKTFPKGITPKVNIIARLELELALLRFCSLVIEPLYHEDASLSEAAGIRN